MIPIHPGPLPYDTEAHAEYVRRLDALYDPVPAPDTTRHVIDVADIWPANALQAARRWAAQTDLGGRPWASVGPAASPGCHWLHNDPVLAHIGRLAEPAVSECLGRPAYFSYGGLKVMYRGVPLIRHRDLNEVSAWLLAWPICHDVAPADWPLSIERPAGDGGAVVDVFPTRPDRAMLFVGDDVWHWRDPYPGRRAVMAHCRFADRPATVLPLAELAELAAHGAAELAGETPPPLSPAVRARVGLPRRPPKRCVVVRRLVDPSDLPGIASLAGDTAATRGRISSPDGPVVDETIRSGSVRWIARDRAEWLWERLERAVAVHAPQLVPDCPHQHRYAPPAQVQLATYEPGEHFSKHVDSEPDQPATRARRITAIVPLQLAAEGGILEVDGYGPLDLSPGDAALFSSTTPHSVSPVIAGRRRSVTAWFSAPGM